MNVKGHAERNKVNIEVEVSKERQLGSHRKKGQILRELGRTNDRTRKNAI